MQVARRSRQRIGPGWQRCSTLLRLGIAIGGGYLCARWLATAVAVLFVVVTGMARSDAVYLGSMLAPLLYLILLLWSCWEPRWWRLVVLMSGGIIAGIVLQGMLNVLPGPGALNGS